MKKSALKPGTKRLHRDTPLKRVNAKRKASEFARAYGSRARVAMVKALPCRVDGCERTPSENAHSRTGGTGRKSDARYILPLCHTHHAELHRVGRQTWEAKHDLDLDWCAEWTAWQVGGFA